MTPAEYCRAQGWQVGDVLQTEYYRQLDHHLSNRYGLIYRHKECTVYAAIKIIGEYDIWGIFKDNPGPLCFHGGCWAIDPDEQNWRKIGHMDLSADKLEWPK